MIALALSVLLVGIASYRLTRIVTSDEITVNLRRWLYETAEIGSDFRHKTARFTYRLVSCAFCLGFWVSLGLWSLWRHPWGSLGPARWLVCWFSVAGVQSFVASRNDA